MIRQGQRYWFEAAIGMCLAVHFDRRNAPSPFRLSVRETQENPRSRLVVEAITLAAFAASVEWMNGEEESGRRDMILPTYTFLMSSPPSGYPALFERFTRKYLLSVGSVTIIRDEGSGGEWYEIDMAVLSRRMTACGAKNIRYTDFATTAESIFSQMIDDPSRVSHYASLHCIHRSGE